MILAKIVGTVVATRKDDRLVSSKLLVARPMDPRGKAEGSYLVAVDTVDAGIGETVLIVSGSSARMAAGLKDCPVDAAIVGIVDSIEIKDRLMQLARVIGEVVATIKDRQPGRDHAPRAAAHRAVRRRHRPDARRAGFGRRRRRRARVLRPRPRGRVPVLSGEPPTDAAIVGIVDHWHAPG